MPARWNAVYRIIKNIKEPIGAEIGVFRGDMSEKLLELHKGLRLFLVDTWATDTYNEKGNDAISEKSRPLHEDLSLENYLHVEETMKKFGERAAILKYMSVQASRLIPYEYLDFAFIDAAHDYESVIEDIKAWAPKVKTGGYICGHDYGVENYPGVKKAVDHLFSQEMKTWNVPECFKELNLTKVVLDNDFTWFVKI